jgi:hypothetical protein
MGMKLLIAVLCVCSALLCGCQGKQDIQKKSGHGEQQPSLTTEKKSERMISVVKKAVFDVNKSKPVGKAMDEYQYFTKREWQETDAQNRTIYVDFIGDLDPKELSADSKKAGVVARSVNIKFVVKSDGTYFVGMITQYDTKSDGKVYPLPMTDVAGVMNAIYANKELPQL